MKNFYEDLSTHTIDKKGEKMKNNLKKILSRIICVFGILSTTTAFTNAATVSGTYDTTISSSVGWVNARCTAYHYSSGNTRWARAWNDLGHSDNISAVYISSTMTVYSDTSMYTNATYAMTDWSYTTANGYGNHTFTYSGGVVY